MKDTTLPKCVIFGETERGAGCVGGQEKQWIGCFQDDFRDFGINVGQRTTAAQDEGEWRRTVEQVVCPNVAGRTKERIAKKRRVRAGSLAIVDYPQMA